MLLFIKHIIRRMVELARRIWSILIPAFVGLIGISLYTIYWLDGKWYQALVSISLAILALICLVIGVIMLIYDFKTTWRKEHNLLWLWSQRKKNL